MVREAQNGFLAAQNRDLRLAQNELLSSLASILTLVPSSWHHVALDTTHGNEGGCRRMQPHPLCVKIDVIFDVF